MVLAQCYDSPDLAISTDLLKNECWVLTSRSAGQKWWFVFTSHTEAKLTRTKSTGWSHWERNVAWAHGQLLNVPDHRRVSPRQVPQGMHRKLDQK